MYITITTTHIKPYTQPYQQLQIHVLKTTSRYAKGKNSAIFFFTNRQKYVLYTV
jgi:hypothetical protein